MAKGVDSRRLIYAPRAVSDLEELERKYAHQILDDLELLLGEPWPSTKVRKLRGCDFMELKTGDYRAIFKRKGELIVVVRVVNRKELVRAIGAINPVSLRIWLTAHG